VGESFPRGSMWNRWDLHFHTPSSYDYEDKSVTNEQIVSSLVGAGIRVVAVTDHHVIDTARVRQLRKLGAEKLTILPGIELRAELGGEPIHYICIFPEDCDLDYVWMKLQGNLGLAEPDVARKGGDEGVYVSIKDGAAAARELGGVVSIHAGAKSNSIENIPNYKKFQQRIKYDITNQYVDLMEIGQLKDVDTHLRVIFPETGLDRALVLCSDNHNASRYEVKAPLWLRADPTFRGLLMVRQEPRDRVYIGDRPLEMVRVDQNRTKYIRTISFERTAQARASEQWFSGSIEFNPGLVAIVGNKGSGKSALADTLGLLGDTKNSDAFSFLSKERFRHPTGGLAQFFRAALTWESGDTTDKCLADPVPQEAVERLKHLPQDYVEAVCNELAGIGEGGFEQELKAVIFSHVPDAQRLGQLTLDELVRFQTGEKQKRIDSLLRQLREVSRSRAVLEAEADPATKRGLQEKITRRELELKAHDQSEPVKVEDPAAGPAAPAAGETLLRELTKAEAEKAELSSTIAALSKDIGEHERRRAVAKRLLEKLANFTADFAAFRADLQEDAAELGVSVDELVSVTITDAKPAKARDDAATAIEDAQCQLGTATTPGLRRRLADADKSIIEIRSKLDAPNRAYQSYLRALGEWQTKRSSIEGNATEPESLLGLSARLAALGQLPARIAKTREQQMTLALQIHGEKRAQAEVYRRLYGPVQESIDSHSLAKGKLSLEFRTALTNVDFSEKLLNMLSQNRRGSFMGVEEGRARAEHLVRNTDWDDAQAVRGFLTDVDRALHTDLRDRKRASVQLRDQLLKGMKPEEVFDLLYGLEYVLPRYVLRWQGKELSMLSPGERGALLLVFYLLIDKGDMPLVMDQPECNLDNHTVATLLAPCIKEARKRRQVFIVTHNPNLAVVCDADQVIHASMDKESGNAITYSTGALENPAMSQYITDVLEGTRWAFHVRDEKYKVGEETGLTALTEA